MSFFIPVSLRRKEGFRKRYLASKFTVKKVSGWNLALIFLCIKTWAYIGQFILNDKKILKSGHSNTYAHNLCCVGN